MKTLHQIRTGLAAAAALTLMAGCASNYHYSQIDGRRYFKTNIDTYSVLISRIDGESPSTRPPALVDPGVRTIEVQGPPSITNTAGELRNFTLDVKPCTLYYLVAVKAARLDNDFTVRVDYEEPVPGCTPPPIKPA